ncbi:hypothetical protein [Jiella sp. M17.18]|uniref:hypothetical protein n=1 Tax=Jiella sp. M17.18 TaxID=3234247 RepID=UPI0034DFFA1D
MTLPENPDWGIHIMAAIAIVLLMGLYIIGILCRNVVFPAKKQNLRSHLAAGIPVGFITMGPYGKAALSGINLASPDMLFNLMITFGYAIIFGMMSRETLDKIIATAPVGGGRGG